MQVHWLICLHQRFLPQYALWADSVMESPCPSVCLSVCLNVSSQNAHFRVLWRLSVQEHSPNMTQFSQKRAFLFFWDFKNARSCTSLLSIVGELLGEGLWLWLLAVCTSMALPWHLKKKNKKKKNILMLLSALVERFCVSRMLDFFYNNVSQLGCVGV